MGEWTHSICDECWKEQNGNRLAFRVTKSHTELCCYCRKIHVSGIYVKDKPEHCQYKGKHED